MPMSVTIAKRVLENGGERCCDICGKLSTPYFEYLYFCSALKDTQGNDVIEGTFVTCAKCKGLVVRG